MSHDIPETVIAANGWNAERMVAATEAFSATNCPACERTPIVGERCAKHRPATQADWDAFSTKYAAHGVVIRNGVPTIAKPDVSQSFPCIYDAECRKAPLLANGHCSSCGGSSTMDDAPTAEEAATAVALEDFASCAEPERVFVCPVDPEHDSFAATHRETVAFLFDGNGEFVEELSNSLEGEGYEGEVWCRDCDRKGVHTVVAADANEVLR